MLELGICPKKLTAETIRLGREFMTPKFVGLDVEPKTPAGVERCMDQLATALEDALLRPGIESRCPPLPLEVNHLLGLMKYGQAAALMPLILYHPALVPMENRADYSARLYGIVRRVLKYVDKAGYEFILDNVGFPKNWDARLRTNKHLKAFYDSTPADKLYDPQGLLAIPPSSRQQGHQMSPREKTTSAREAASEALRFNRNMDAYGLVKAVHSGSPHGLRFNRTDMARMLYCIMDGLLCSVANCLATMNLFECLDLQSLFPGRVVSRKGWGEQE